MTLCLPGTEVAEVPCEVEDREAHGVHEDRGDHGDPAPSCGGVHEVRQVPSCREEEVPLGVPTAGPECSADCAFCPAALGSEEKRVSS